MVYWLLKYVLIGPFLRITARPRVVGMEHFPSTGAALFVCNHLSVADWLFFPLVAPRRLTFLAKSEYFTRPGPIGRLQKAFFELSGQYPIDRTNADTAQAALETGERLLLGGDLLVMFPEGTRSPDGRLYRGKTGPARLAMRAGVPLVPVGLVGTGDYLPLDSTLPRPTRVTVRVGEPIDLSPWAGRVGDRAAEREITDLLMERIRDLTGQEYVPDVYGADMKQLLVAGDDTAV